MPLSENGKENIEEISGRKIMEAKEKSMRGKKQGENVVIAKQAKYLYETKNKFSCRKYFQNYRRTSRLLLCSTQGRRLIFRIGGGGAKVRNNSNFSARFARKVAVSNIAR